MAYRRLLLHCVNSLREPSYLLAAYRPPVEKCTNRICFRKLPRIMSLLNDFIMISFIYSAAFHGGALIHASCIAIDDKGVAFVGPSGIGKSTHSQLWLKHIPGARLLNDDQPILRLMPGGEVMLFGSPWSGKTSCYINEGVRLETIFRMEQADETVRFAWTG